VANLWRKFKTLIDGPPLEVVTVLSISGGTSKCATYSNGVVIVSGSNVPVGNKAFIQDGRIVGEAPDLTYYEIEV